MKAFSSFFVGGPGPCLPAVGSPPIHVEPRQHIPFSVTLQQVPEDSAKGDTETRSDPQEDGADLPESSDCATKGSPVETFPRERAVIEGAADTRPVPAAGPLQQLAQRILRAVSVEQVGQRTVLHLELSTPGLQRMALDLSLEGGKLSLRFAVVDQAARDLLRAATSELAAGLQARGLDLAAVQVECVNPQPLKQRGGSATGHGGGGRTPMDQPTDHLATYPQKKACLGHTRRSPNPTSYVV